jgi:two-component system OmpR family response regulator
MHGTADVSLRRILFVEDDPDIQTVAKMALEALGGFTVLACSSGAEALAEVDGFSPDLVLLDVMMPGMDGPTTLAGLRERPAGREVPVVFMTAKVQTQEMVRYRALGAEEVIAKPFDPMALAERVRTIWSGIRREEGGTHTAEGGYHDYFAGRLPDRLREIEEASERARETAWSTDAVRDFHRLAHSLTGAGATFGFPAVTQAARALEARLKAVVHGREPAPDAAAVEDLLEGIRTAARTQPV